MFRRKEQRLTEMEKQKTQRDFADLLVMSGKNLRKP